ncbi:hypothetical protein C2G38_2118097 [Gigaspora rosea]|uniref:Uncharacterized protein n=1 Tax=Gigaspora rosea TaxID=44941 RepID=A0A397U916_9GLOM|nr:hypothetical protein C2G38_2118097 [Gigaspora rosea]
MDLFLILLNGSNNKSELPWPITLFGTTLYVAMLYFIPSGKITIVQAAQFGVYFFLLISMYISCLENGFQTLSHANFFAVPPFGYIFVSKSFGRMTTIIVCVIYVISFVQSIGKEIPISLSATGWVICDVYILCFVYFLFVAYEQEFHYNQERMQKSLDEARSAETAKSMFISNVSHEILDLMD